MARASCLLMVAMTVTALTCDAVNPPSTTTVLSGASKSTSKGFNSCGGVMRCLNETQCARCLSAINASRGFVHSQAEYYSMSLAAQRAYQVGFFEMLLSTASCWTNATSPDILYPALQELGGTCQDAHGMVVNRCLLAEYVVVHWSLLALLKLSVPDDLLQIVSSHC